MTQPEGEPVTLDLSDRWVRDMVDINHVPQEIWTAGGTLVSVACRTCGYEWPCPTRRQLQEWDTPVAMNRDEATATYWLPGSGLPGS